MKKVFGVYLLILLANIFTFGQQYSLPEIREFSTSTIRFLNSDKIMASDMSIVQDSVYYRNDHTSKYQVAHLNQLEYLRVTEGTHFTKGVVLGILSASVISLYAILSVHTDNDRRLKDNAINTVGIWVGSGAILGGLFGATSPRMKTYYLEHPNTLIIKAQPKILISNNYYGVGLIFPLN